MNTRQLGETLNRLLHAEQSSLIPRMAESTVFISWAANDEALLLEHMIAEEREQVGWLVDLINDIGESPTPATPDAWHTSAHFVEITYLLPAVMADLERRVGLCSEIGSQVAHHADAAEVLGRLGARHREHLDKLRTMHAGLQSPQETE